MIIFGNIKQQSTEYMRGITDAQHDVEQHGLDTAKRAIQNPYDSSLTDQLFTDWHTGYTSFLKTRQALLADIDYQVRKCEQELA